MAKDKHDSTVNETSFDEEISWLSDRSKDSPLREYNQDIDNDFNKIYQKPGVLFAGVYLLLGISFNDNPNLQEKIKNNKANLEFMLSLCSDDVVATYTEKVIFTGSGLNVINDEHEINCRKVKMNKDEYWNLPLKEQEELALLLGGIKFEQNEVKLLLHRIVEKLKAEAQPSKHESEQGNGLNIIHIDTPKPTEIMEDIKKRKPCILKFIEGNEHIMNYIANGDRIIELMEKAKNMPKVEPLKAEPVQAAKPMPAPAAQPPKPMPAPAASPQFFSPVVPQIQEAKSPNPKQIMKDQKAQVIAQSKQKFIEKLTTYKREIEQDLRAGKEYDFLGMGISKKEKLAVVDKIITHLERNYSIRTLEFNDLEKRAMDDGRLKKIVSEGYEYDVPGIKIQNQLKPK